MDPGERRERTGSDGVNQGQLAQAIAKRFSLELSLAEEIVEFALDQIAQALKAGSRVYFRGFGACKRSGVAVPHPRYFSLDSRWSSLVVLGTHGKRPPHPGPRLARVGHRGNPFSDCHQPNLASNSTIG